MEESLIQDDQELIDDNQQEYQEELVEAQEQLKADEAALQGLILEDDDVANFDARTNLVLESSKAALATKTLKGYEKYVNTLFCI